MMAQYFLHNRCLELMIIELCLKIAFIPEKN